MRLAQVHVGDENDGFLCTRHALQVFLPGPKSDYFFDPRQREQMRFSMVKTALDLDLSVVWIWHGWEEESGVYPLAVWSQGLGIGCRKPVPPNPVQLTGTDALELC